MESNRAVFFCLQPEGFLSGTWTVIHYAQPDPSADGTTLHVYYFSKGGGPWNFPIEDAHEVFVRFPNDTGRKFGADDSDISILRRLSPSEYKL